ncbi:adenosylcobalamin-dependent ribonucleoside-diphosphate reductase [Candidatus Berkelbacteria bacterium]|nr:adenosylcobalamin-dependent ribonucleoside-diphosphate reductase [Candidatus Berkelbacteria bacterium]
MTPTKYDPQTATVNKLNEIGYKIFLDRYAVKDRTKGAIKKGDTVVVCTNLETSQREIGTVTDINKSEATVKLRVDDSEVTRSLEHIDKPTETDPTLMHERVARGVAAVEKTPKLRKQWEANFKSILTDWKFVPAGRILTGAGSDQNLTYYNCYVVPSPHDSRGGIMDTLNQMAEIMSRGGGVGINLSSLRPRYDFVKGVNGRSSGAVSWGSLYSFVTGLIEQGGSRRGALMLILNVWHPDVEEFISSKTEMGKITNANISVGVTDDFMEAVRNDGDWTFIAPDRTDPDYDKLWDGNLDTWRQAGKKITEYKTIRARELWDKIIHSAWASAEPGLFFIDRYNKMSPSSYFAPILCTNPCGEQGLPGWGVCNLGAINFAKFVDEEKKEVKWDELGETIQMAVRFLDNVIDATPYFFDENLKQQMSERRVGLNSMGLAEMMIKLGLRYGSEEGNEFIDNLYEFFATQSYLTSSEIAKEKGSFPKFKVRKHLETGFIKTLPKEVKDAIKRNGLRNVTLNTQAPNGTIGTMVGTSTGIEPFYDWTYQRKSRLGMHEERVDVYDDWMINHPNQELPDYFVTAKSLSPEEHISVQATIQRWVDSSISKTCNVPNHYTEEQVGELYRLMYDLGCKGGTVYRDGSRDIQVLSSKSEDTANDSNALANQESSDKSPAPVSEALPTAVGIVPKKRPEVMRGTTYKTMTAYGAMYVTINDDEHNQPYEIFTTLGKTGGFFAAKTEAISRLVSLSLRTGISADEIVDQLKGIRGPSPVWGEGGMILSIPDAISRILARHINKDQGKLELDFDQKLPESQPDLLSIPKPEKEKVPAMAQVGPSPTGNASIANLGMAPACPECSSMLIFQEGCLHCSSCGYSKCA